MKVLTISYVRRKKRKESKQNLKKPILFCPCVNDSSISEHLSLLSRPLPPAPLLPCCTAAWRAAHKAASQLL